MNNIAFINLLLSFFKTFTSNFTSPLYTVLECFIFDRLVYILNLLKRIDAIEFNAKEFSDNFQFP